MFQEFNAMRLLVALVLASLLPVGSSTQTGQSSQSSSATPAAAIQQPQTVLKATTRLVVVDVVATDSSGAPVTDLKESDFTVLEDGQPQKIGSFNFQGAAAKNGPPPAKLPPNVVTNVPASQSNSLNVILLDHINGESRNRIYAQDRLVKFLDRASALEPTAIFVMEKKLSLIHDFTTDTRVLKDALNNMPSSGVSRVIGVDAAASPYATKGDFHTDENAIEVTLRALRQLARTLAAYPGRKNLIWVSEAFPVNLMIEGFPKSTSPNNLIADRAGSVPLGTPVGQQPTVSAALTGGPENLGLGSGNSFAQELARIADALMDAHVALYPIDAAGVGSANRIAAQSNMRDMADRTGGRAFYNRNDLDVGVGSSINDGSIYYGLSYYPENHVWDGRLRRIEIKTSRPGITLRYRMGYYALNPEGLAKRDSIELAQEFTYAMEFDSPLFAGVRFQAMVTPPADKSQKTTVIFAIDPHTIAFENRGDGEHLSIACSVAVYSEKGSLVKNAKEETTSLSGALKPDEYQKVMKSVFPCKHQMDLKSGKYTLRLGAIDMNGHAFGTSNASLVVP